MLCLCCHSGNSLENSVHCYCGCPSSFYCFAFFRLSLILEVTLLENWRDQNHQEDQGGRVGARGGGDRTKRITSRACFPEPAFSLLNEQRMILNVRSATDRTFLKSSGPCKNSPPAWWPHGVCSHLLRWSLCCRCYSTGLLFILLHTLMALRPHDSGLLKKISAKRMNQSYRHELQDRKQLEFSYRIKESKIILSGTVEHQTLGLESVTSGINKLQNVRPASNHFLGLMINCRNLSTSQQM